jgi:hypothetical protein
MRALFNAEIFLWSVHRRMRFGEFSRRPLRLLRLEWKSACVECDWIMRSADPWDRILPERLAEEHQTLQALRDAMSLRDMVFGCFPEVDQAALRMFRTRASVEPELMMTGFVQRSNEVLPRVASVALRAKLCGFHFSLSEGVLESMPPMSTGFI